MEQGDRDILNHAVAVLETSEARLYEQVASTFRWLMATLFTANGGALVALLGNEAIASKGPKLSLAFFAAGVVSSVLMAVFNAAFASKALLPTTALRMAFAGLASGKSTMKEIDEKMTELDKPDWLRIPLYGSGTSAFVCLVGGMLSFACSA